MTVVPLTITAVQGVSPAQSALASGYQLAFGVAAATCFIGSLLSLFLLRADRQGNPLSVKRAA
jgi:hypothetical protein